MDNIKLLYIDLFCGAGGTSTGVEFARLDGEKCAKVIACVNHDPNAILSHQANHPDTLHFTEDIRTLELTGLVEHLGAMRKKHPEAHVVLWASLECTNFSRAKGGSVDAPCFTLIASMNKMPPYLVCTEKGEVGIAIFDDDSPMTVKIKEFMALYGIVDIKMRMLKIPELKKIMGVPEDYVLIGTQAEQKKFIGNAVEVNMSRVLCEALCGKLVTTKHRIEV